MPGKDIDGYRDAYAQVDHRLFDCNDNEIAVKYWKADIPKWVYVYHDTIAFGEPPLRFDIEKLDELIVALSYVRVLMKEASDAR